MRAKRDMSRETKRIAVALVPLSRAEASRAVAAAVTYLKPELLRDGESRFRVLGAELSLSRPRIKRAPVKRQVEVLVVDYLGRRHVRAVVERGRVVEVRALDGQPAFAQDETAEAESIAIQAPQLRAIARRRGVFSSPFAPGGCDPGTRRLGLHFVLARGTAPAVLLASAEVDLVERRLLGYDISGAGALIGGKGD